MSVRRPSCAQEVEQLVTHAAPGATGSATLVCGWEVPGGLAGERNIAQVGARKGTIYRNNSWSEQSLYMAHLRALTAWCQNVLVLFFSVRDSRLREVD